MSDARLKEIYAEHHDWALRVARSVIGSSSHDAEDVVSEVFLAVHKAFLAGGGPRDNIRGYLRRAIQNQATQLWAKRKFEDVTDAVPEQEYPDPAEALLRAVERQRELTKCPPSYVIVLYRVDVLGESTEEAATALGMTVPSVKSILHRARKAITLAA
ncbi:RNA polymerase sigma factor [Microbacterium sp. 77mftsu3.1]|uniref:RNA polymerase sigma factor n=1 Tax=Microbacterium sp. 77mftsu3.1 TaxID=1761802 RepID=UPI0003645F8E|nr:RNA polymerase sigma factor [Microbacterium sp. 77mftsu3.1]SDH42296.1 RNA polymerase sigma-70 factor, ECF subfamily [Microbacterium sp. 77mftsu3.1]